MRRRRSQINSSRWSISRVISLDPGMSIGKLPLQLQRLLKVLAHHHASRGQPYANTTSYGTEDANTLVHGNFKRGRGGIFAQQTTRTPWLFQRLPMRQASSPLYHSRRGWPDRAAMR
jgi:hypothetical protein